MPAIKMALPITRTAQQLLVQICQQQGRLCQLRDGTDSCRTVIKTSETSLPITQTILLATESLCQLQRRFYQLLKHLEQLYDESASYRDSSAGDSE